ncbi:MAG: hypothetical protein EBT15_09965 [Betaproteobacteria bacterium]|nr:hypothetical protein [Betaproteobacteria bacterium]
MSKSVAKSLYLEFRRETHTAQVILTPPTNNPVSGKFEPAHVLNRQISENHPRRPWKFYTSDNPSDLGLAPTMEEGATRSLPIANELSSFFSGFYAGGWALYQTPLVVEMSQDDLNAIASKETPNALIRRVLRARTEAGFSEELWETLVPALPASTPSAFTASSV